VVDVIAHLPPDSRLLPVCRHAVVSALLLLLAAVTPCSARTLANPRVDAEACGLAAAGFVCDPDKLLAEGDANLVGLVAAQLQKQGNFVGVAVMAQQGGEKKQGNSSNTMSTNYEKHTAKYTINSSNNNNSICKRFQFSLQCNRRLEMFGGGPEERSKSAERLAR